MKKIFLNSYFVGCMLVAVLTGCSKEERPVSGEEEVSMDSIGSVSHLPGFGDSNEHQQVHHLSCRRGYVLFPALITLLILTSPNYMGI